MRWTLLFLPILAGCVAYPDDCNRRALHQLRVVEGLIAETEANLARGYAYEYVDTGFDTGFVLCSGTWNATICTGNDTRYTRQPVAIDPQSERRKLEALVARRDALGPDVAACRPV